MSGNLSRISLLDRVRDTMPSMRTSEKKVASVVLRDPELIRASTMAGVAAAAGVSEPTVMRFAMHMGFDGFQAFKLALTQVLAVGVPLTDRGISMSDSLDDISKKVFDHSISSLALARQTYDAKAIERAVDLMADAMSLTFIGFGASGIIAQDAEQKSGLFGIPCSAPIDAHQQVMAAAMCSPGDVFLLISNTGSTEIVLEVGELARRHGATTIALTGDPEAPLAQSCDVVLIANTYEDTDVFTPTVSRLAGLVLVDILTAAVAARRGTAHLQRLQRMKQDLLTFRIGGTGDEKAPR